LRNHEKSKGKEKKKKRTITQKLAEFVGKFLNLSCCNCFCLSSVSDALLPNSLIATETHNRTLGTYWITDIHSHE